MVSNKLAAQRLSLILALAQLGIQVQALGKTPAIGIMAALPQEIAVLKADLEIAQTRNLGGDEFVVGKLGSAVVVVTLSGVGKVNAAVAAQRLISEFGVSAIIFTGVAGGIEKTLNIGDIVVGTHLFQHDYGYLGENFVPRSVGTLPEVGIGTGEEALKMQMSWPKLEENMDFLASTIAHFKTLEERFASVLVNEKEYRPSVRWGTIATGDQFIANENKRRELAQLGVSVVEMEGAAVAQVAQKNGISAMIIRSVSDKAGEKAKLDFGKFVSSVAVNNALLVKEILKAHFAR